jgi:hypothetical protein
MTKSSFLVDLDAKRLALIKALLKDNPGIELTSIRAKMLLWSKYALDMQVSDCALALQEMAQEGLVSMQIIDANGMIVKCSYIVKVQYSTAIPY